MLFSILLLMLASNAFSLGINIRGGDSSMMTIVSELFTVVGCLLLLAMNFYR
jgi:hypothetical protein